MNTTTVTDRDTLLVELYTAASFGKSELSADTRALIEKTIAYLLGEKKPLVCDNNAAVAHNGPNLATILEDISSLRKTIDSLKAELATVRARHVSFAAAHHHASDVMFPSANSGEKLQCFYWKSKDVGTILVCDKNIELARAAAMSLLSKKDAARAELEIALRAEPELIGDKPLAIANFIQ